MIRITFTRPEMLLGLLIIPIMIILHFYFLRTTKKKALRFANFRVLKRITGKRFITKNNTVLALRIIAITIIILSAAGTTINYKGPTNKNTYVIAIDNSASMSSEDVPPTRLKNAQEEAKQIIDKTTGETNIGIITFSGVTEIKKTPDKNKEELKKTIDEITISKSGGTDIPAAIITATNLLIPYNTGKEIILISDGSNTIQTYIDKSITRAIKYAKERGVIINTIGLGTNKGPIGYLPTYYNVSTIYNEQTLEEIANQTGGTYQHIRTGDEEIKYLKELNRTETRIITKPISQELMIIALIIILIEWTLTNTRYRIIP